MADDQGEVRGSLAKDHMKFVRKRHNEGDLSVQIYDGVYEDDLECYNYQEKGIVYMLLMYSTTSVDIGEGCAETARSHEEWWGLYYDF